MIFSHYKKAPFIFFVFILSIILLTSCSTGRHPTTGASYYGKASWYGKTFHGRKTASGERYNMYAFTAAHKRLSFGTKVKVTYLKTKKSVIVKINDRGPYTHGRVLDLSYAAAKKIGLTRDGVGKIKYRILN